MPIMLHIFKVEYKVVFKFILFTRERGKEDIPSTILLPRCPEVPGWGQTGEPGTQPRSPLWVEESSYMATTTASQQLPS